MNFAELSDFLETVRQTKTVSEKTKLAKTFFIKLRDNKIDTFPVLRLVVPKLDRDRPSYRIKESKISKLLIKMLGLPTGNDRNLLIHSVNSSVDFGDVVFSILKKYIVNKEVGLTVDHINTYLDQIANRTSDKGLDDLVLEIFRKLSPQNIKWLIQIIVKDLKLGISDNNVLKCFHEDGENFYASNNNLRKLCEVLSNPTVKLHELAINIFEAFRPMLSKRCDAANFKKCFPEDKLFIIENKFDGERFQIHMENKNFKYFSRNGYDYTNYFGQSFNDGIFTPLLKDVFDPETKRVILDGEMMLWNKNTNSFGSKGMNLDVKNLSFGKYQPCFCVFDILLYNDRVLTNQPLSKRIQILKHVVKNPTVGTIVVSTHSEGCTRSDIVDALNSCVDNNEEGIVVKDPKSVYKCSDRNSGWFKVKMEYFDDVVHDLDVLLMGGFYEGRKIMTSFMVGVSSGPDTYFSLGRIGSGLNAEQLDVLNTRLTTRGVEYRDFSIKSEGKLFFGRETPDVYIEPQYSFVLQIRATELIRVTSDHVKCPYTLRFPRVLSIRSDKPVDECLTMNELLEFTGQNKAVIKLNKRHIELEEILAKSKAKRVKTEVEVINLEQTSGEFLATKRFYVESGTQKWTTEEIYHAIKKSGGDVTYRLENNIDVVLTSKITPRLFNMFKQSNNFDIVHVDWLRRVLEAKQLLDYNEEEIFYCGNNFHPFSSKFDKYGDDFVEAATKESLMRVLGNMRNTGEFLNTNGGDAPFQRYIAYFDKFEDVNDARSKRVYYSFPDEAEFRYHGGVVKEELEGGVNLVVIQDCDKRRGVICKFLESKGLAGVEIVTRDFVCGRK